jgi:hypothetical protein
VSEPRDTEPTAVAGGSIVRLLGQVMQELGAVGRDHKNEQQGFYYRGIDDLYNAVHPLLAKRGILLPVDILEHQRSEKQSARGGTLLYSIVKVRHRFTAPDLSYLDVVTVGEGMDSGDKATGKAMSAAMKYALIQLFTIPTKDLDDADASSPEVGAQQRKQAEPKPAADPLQQRKSAVARRLGKLHASARRDKLQAALGRVGTDVERMKLLEDATRKLENAGAGKEAA